MDANEQIKIPRLLWMELIHELKRRGAGKRESGAFLLGQANEADHKIIEYICYDDLDPNALKSGIVIFHGSGYTALWDYCSKKNLKVLADVHTHPTKDTRQSYIDRENPMVPVVGHVALILPKYGNATKWSLEGVGIHVFNGGGKWTSHPSSSTECPIKLSLW